MHLHTLAQGRFNNQVTHKLVEATWWLLPPGWWKQPKWLLPPSWWKQPFWFRKVDAFIGLRCFEYKLCKSLVWPGRVAILWPPTWKAIPHLYRFGQPVRSTCLCHRWTPSSCLHMCSWDAKPHLLPSPGCTCDCLHHGPHMGWKTPPALFLMP